MVENQEILEKSKSNKSKKSRKYAFLWIVILVLVLLPIVAFIIPIIIRTGLADQQQGGSPYSDRPSFVMQLYEDLSGLRYGSESPDIWGDYTAVWNRIFSAGLQQDKFVPYEGVDQQNWDLYSVQGYVVYDDYKKSQSGHANYSKPSTSYWTDNGGGVWKDMRTGLYWGSGSASAMSNIFDVNGCSFFTANDRGAWSGSTADCGDAIVYCRNLSLGGRTDWYLPSQDELYQVYLNGMYTETTTAFTTINSFWSSTEFSDNATSAWSLSLMRPNFESLAKSSSSYVRCVARD